MKKKLRLKSWVKELILIILVAGVLFMAIKFISENTKEAIRDCVNTGHSQYYCEKGLN